MKSNLKKVEEMYLLNYFASHSALGIAICKIAYGKRHFCGLASNFAERDQSIIQFIT